MKNLINFINEKQGNSSDKMSVQQARRILRNYDKKIDQAKLDELSDLFDDVVTDDEFDSIMDFNDWYDGLKGTVRSEFDDLLEKFGATEEWFHAWIVNLVGREV